MEDDTWLAHADDWSSVDLECPREVQFWSEEFDIPPAKLAALVEQVGPAIDDVVRALRR